LGSTPVAARDMLLARLEAASAAELVAPVAVALVNR